MSDSIDRQDASPDGTPREPLLRGEWRENDALVHGVSPTQTRSFEGASSMLELASSPANTDRASSSDSEQNLRKLLKDVENLRKPGQTLPREPLTAESSYVDRFLERARAALCEPGFQSEPRNSARRTQTGTWKRRHSCLGGRGAESFGTTTG